jgi:cell division protein FtsI/penicillin-binding protein 2
LLHTSHVLLLRKSRFSQWIAVAAVLAAQAYCRSAPTADWQAAVQHAAQTAPDARIVVIDIASNKLLTSHHLAEAARTLAAPGSTLKPLVLYQLLIASRWNADRRIACDRHLVIAGHGLACSHPALAPFDAQEALAWSCNTYFAQVARSLVPGELGRLLHSTGLLDVTGMAAKIGAPEASAEFHEPENAEAVKLAMLGVEGIRVTPFELAAAYRWLAIETAAHSDSAASRTLRAGLADSVRFGMASAASMGGVSVAGKTGTAEGAATAQTHGWFAGVSPAENPRVVVVVYLPSGRGTDAARVAADLLGHASGARP